MLEMTENPSGRKRSNGLQPSGISDHTRGSVLQMEIPAFIVQCYLEIFPGMNVRALLT